MRYEVMSNLYTAVSSVFALVKMISKYLLVIDCHWHACAYLRMINMCFQDQKIVPLSNVSNLMKYMQISFMHDIKSFTLYNASIITM